MMDKKDQYLPLFLTEPVYVVSGDSENSSSSRTDSAEPVSTSTATPAEHTEEAPSTPPDKPAERKETHPLVIWADAKLDDAEKAFLTKVLKAVNRNLSDAEIASIERKNMLEGEKNLYFNVSPEEAGLAGYEKYAVSKGNVFCDKLSDIESNVNLKRKLWSALQQMFDS